MAEKPTYEELERKVRELQDTAIEWERVKKVLQETGELYRNVYDTAPLAFVVWDIDTRVTDWNRKAEEVFGWSKKEALGRSFFDFLIPQKDLPHVETVVDKLVKGELPNYSVNDNLTKSGRVITCEWNNSTHHDDEGNVVGAISLALDITERKRAEEALRREKDFTDAALNSQMDTFFLFNPPTGKAIRWNKAFRDIVGYTDEEIASLPAPASYYSSIDLEQGIPFLEKIMTEGKGTIELELICKDGRRVPTEYRVAAIYDQDGKPENLISIGRDITERKQAEEALRKSESRFRTIFEQAAVGVAQIVSKTGHFLHINKRYADIVGYTVEEMGQLTFQKITHPDDLQEDLDNVKRLLDGEIREFSMEKRYYHKNGSIVWVKLTVSSMWQIGEEPNYHIAVVEDITKRKQAEETLKEKEAELRLNAKSLKEVNTTLRVLLKERQKDQTNLEEKVVSNVKGLVLPYIDKIKKSSLDSNQMSCIHILESNLEEIVSPFTQKLSSSFLGLTPTEIRVANLVKEGKTTKEIAEFIHLSPKTVEFHRNNLRKKLGIKKSKTNLRTYLSSI